MRESESLRFWRKVAGFGFLMMFILPMAHYEQALRDLDAKVSVGNTGYDHFNNVSVLKEHSQYDAYDLQEHPVCLLWNGSAEVGRVFAFFQGNWLLMRLETPDGSRITSATSQPSTAMVEDEAKWWAIVALTMAVTVVTRASPVAFTVRLMVEAASSDGTPTSVRGNQNAILHAICEPGEVDRLKGEIPGTPQDLYEFVDHHVGEILQYIGAFPFSAGITYGSRTIRRWSE